MIFFKKRASLLFGASIGFIALLVRLDSVFLRDNSHFCLGFLTPQLPPHSHWNSPPPSSKEMANLNHILDQKFYYLSRGAHCFAFLSEDKQYVIKFHKYASQPHLFPWLSHPFSFLKKKSKRCRDYAEELNCMLSGYKESFESLKEESGLLLVHIDQTDNLKKRVTLVDKLHVEHQVPLDQVTFLLQYKASLFFSALNHFYVHQEFTKAKIAISRVIQLLVTCCQKGYINADPGLRQNYGLLDDKAIIVDIGGVMKNASVMQKESRNAYVKKQTERLKTLLESSYPELLEHYENEMNRL